VVLERRTIVESEVVECIVVWVVGLALALGLVVGLELAPVVERVRIEFVVVIECIESEVGKEQGPGLGTVVVPVEELRLGKVVVLVLELELVE